MTLLRLVVVVGTCLFLFLSARTATAQDIGTLSKGPEPEWAVYEDLPEIDIEREADPIQPLLMHSMTLLGENGLTVFVRAAVRIQNRIGLQREGNVVLPWNALRGDMTFHRLRLLRGDEVIDLLPDTEFKTVHQGQRFDDLIVDGVRLIMAPAKGVRVGDIIEYSMTQKIQFPMLTGPIDQLFEIDIPIEINNRIYEIIVPSQLDAQWEITNQGELVGIEETRFGKKYRFAIGDYEAPDLPAMAPRVEALSYFQVTPLDGWSQVADQYRPLYKEARRVPPDGELAKLAASLMREHETPEDRILAALEEVQAQVRYISISLGAGAYQPVDAETAWENRYADCKGMTAILLALLDEMDIVADPILVNLNNPGVLGQLKPTMLAFDHVLVKATIGERNYYLDGTSAQQYALEDLTGNYVLEGLPLSSGADLEKIPYPTISKPFVEHEITHDLGTEFSNPTPFTMTSIYRGKSASDLRGVVEQASNSEERETFLKTINPYVLNDHIEDVRIDLRGEDGAVVITYSGKQELNWSAITSYAGLSDKADNADRLRFTFEGGSASAFQIPEREEESSLDYEFGAPNWSKLSETFLYPAGKVAIEGESHRFDEHGFLIDREVRKAKGRVSVVTEIRRDTVRLTADEATDLSAKLDELPEMDVFLMLPPGVEMGERENRTITARLPDGTLVPLDGLPDGNDELPEGTIIQIDDFVAVDED